MKPRHAIVILATTAACAVPASAVASSGGPNTATVSRYRVEYASGASRAVRLEYHLRKATVTHVGRTLTFRWYVAKLSPRLARPDVSFEFATRAGHVTELFNYPGGRRFVSANSLSGAGVRKRQINGVGHITSHYAGDYVQWSGVPASLWPKGQKETWCQPEILQPKGQVVGWMNNNLTFVPHR